MKITVAKYCIHFLISKGIRIVPGIPGGTILPIYDALAESEIQHILARQEQGAGFIAQGMARSTGQVSACLVSSGPGVANLLTSVSDAFSDSVPLLIFSGQVPRNLLGTDAFQELPTKSIVSHFTKASYLIMDPLELPHILEEAYLLAGSGRPGPVWIDLPKDVQNEFIDLESQESLISPKANDFTRIKANLSELQTAIESTIRLLHSSKKSLFYIGGGAKKSAEALRRLVDSLQIPVVSTLMGLGIFPKENPNFLGMMGMHGSVSANSALGECDLLIALGVRFDDRATGNIATFCPKAKVIHIDIDPKEIGKNKRADVFWKGDLSAFLENLFEVSSKIKKGNFWQPSPEVESASIREEGRIDRFFRSLSSHFRDSDFILTDVGQHQMWTAQYFPFPNERSWITSGGQGTMGFGLPTSIGVSLAHPDANVFCITGDGSIMMNLQELATLRELNSNVKLIIFNNKHLGLVRQQQELFYENRKSGSVFEFQPNFQMLAESFGIPGYKIMLGDRAEEQMKALLKPGPCLLEVMIPSEAGVYPFVPGGKSNQEFILNPPLFDASKKDIENDLCITS
ncbi:biosynthetic-type acetolactate synthase large subunit [Leptospira ognonensis]|uniref:Acetolactate synthase n=1 Tax=Leptospira ognonensis TaxID=2484945 RepID=A0A4R9K997_9LEPT|nr:biosynthetic-type acetolactate synthase large subunit [Leptospira ognonensis]TGL61288.1 biosynthetic-type acetolactate synthase large subunit [Leptospira ognonensis]